MPFQKGQSGNPAGPKQGTLQKRTLLKRELDSKLFDRGPEIVQKLIDMALSGDQAALKIALDRLLPKNSETTLELTLNNVINKIQTANPILQQLVSAVEGETISFAEATALAKLFNEIPDAANKSLNEVVERLNNTKRVYEIVKK